MSAPRVVCLRPEEDFLQAGVTPPEGLAIAYRAPGDGDLASQLAGAEALVLPSVGPPVGESLLGGAPRLRLIQFTGAGFDRVDARAAARLGADVANVPGANAHDVAEYVVVSAGVLLRGLAWADREIRGGRYAAARAALLRAGPRGFRGLQIGVVGLGHVGLRVAAAFTDLGARVAYCDPHPLDPAAAQDLGAQRMELDGLLAVSDVVSLHVPLLPATRGLLGAAEISRMKPDAILIQASRGGVVDEEALAEALSRGALGGAAIDVFATEPPNPGGPLFRLDEATGRRVLFTPHIGGVTRQASAALFAAAWDNVRRVLVEGRPPLHRVLPAR